MPAVPLPPDLANRLAAWETQPPSSRHKPVLPLFARFGAQGSSPSSRLLALTRAAFAGGYPAAAVAALHEAIDGEPQWGDAQLQLCAFLLRRGDPQAGAALQHCLASFPEPAEGWVAVGEAFLQKGQREACLLCLAKGPPDARLALRCGLLARDLGRPGEAKMWFENTVRLDPSSERGWFQLGTCAQDGRDTARAAEAYRAVLQLNPARVEAEVNLGMVLQDAGDLEGAKRSYGRALRARPETFGRIAQALTGRPKGELWLDLAALRRHLAG